MKHSELTIVADENIPALETYFGDLGRLLRLPGRTLSREQLMDADILLVRSVTRVNEELLSGTPVRFVGSCTIGTDHLDTAWLEGQGIRWSAAPGCNANSVIEYVFCALAALGIDWNGREFGIVGCGNVGGLLRERLQAMNIPCAVYDPWRPDDPDSASLERVLEQDVVCLHAPLVKGGPHPSFHMIGAGQLARIKDGATLISAGRGAVVDNRALLELLRAGKRFNTVLDVWENEPDIDTALLDLVDIGTPHIAGYSADGKLAGTRMIRGALARALKLPQQPAADERHLPVRQLGVGAESSFAEFSAMADYLLQIYDPRADDRRLRAAAGGDQPMGGAFDRLRREYPERLEFSHYRIDGAPLTEHQRRQLAILGLKCEEKCN
ncbi:4-phosphoerythronate dehydrogenase [Microbulbifer thermotolerans]|uniref:Erythronate-4-phosphate dehydrogenase n=1 Tax=Microbulbifer thermotolerans TaxID=252514 RepID=A0A143HMQ2_MICTH|nr:4-phosphoerythronate dehydrogenase [Microbulbifer thermotolerans]AMX02797.1 erythronate-4-phosphate dehydrogenase [Microbulbifer thermotolerans]MCX2782626.1 4-phosphoerythronate dehydrogenase [Microbulbifer thermotolerans]SFB95610.1 erythronate-4-phosphate dehydrogenase [Microbulbifer thermotolerans]